MAFNKFYGTLAVKTFFWETGISSAEFGDVMCVFPLQVYGGNSRLKFS